MEAAIETIRNKEIGSYKASRVFNVPQTTLQPYVKDRKKSSSETVKTKLGRKQVLPCETESDLAEHCLLMERKFFGLTMADVMRLAYQLAVKNEIKNQFCKRNEKARRKWSKNFLRRHPQISVRIPQGLSLSKAMNWWLAHGLDQSTRAIPRGGYRTRFFPSGFFISLNIQSQQKKILALFTHQETGGHYFSSRE